MSRNCITSVNLEIAITGRGHIAITAHHFEIVPGRYDMDDAHGSGVN